MMELYLQLQNDNEKPLSIGMLKRVQEHKETNVDEQPTNGTSKHSQKGVQKYLGSLCQRSRTKESEWDFGRFIIRHPASDPTPILTQKDVEYSRGQRNLR